MVRRFVNHLLDFRSFLFEQLLPDDDLDFHEAEVFHDFSDQRVDQVVINGFLVADQSSVNPRKVFFLMEHFIILN